MLDVAGRAARPANDGAVRCLYLHYVYDDQVDAFRDLLVRLKKMGCFLTTTELLEVQRGERDIDGPAFHLSFDDGFDNVYRNAFPVLEELGVHALFFVPSGFIGAPDQALLDGWWMWGSVDTPTRVVDWSQLREMSDAGHEIGSHTRHHLRLSDISSDASTLEAPVSRSKREIEDALGRSCRSISWPFGTGADFDDASKQAVEAAGYEACFSAMRGAVTRGEGSPLSIPRHHFEPQWPWHHLRYFASGGKEPR